jgi:hypothetical protein
MDRKSFFSFFRFIKVYSNVESMHINRVENSRFFDILKSWLKLLETELQQFFGSHVLSRTSTLGGYVLDRGVGCFGQWGGMFWTASFLTKMNATESRKVYI